MESNPISIFSTIKRDIIRDIQNSNPNTLTEICVRIILLLIVCIIHANLHPHVQYLTEAQLLQDYRRPRIDSITPPWVMLFLVLCVPVVTFVIPYFQTRNSADTIQALLAWSLACAITAFLTETGKLIVGRPRPDFFYRCFPNEKVTKDLRCTGNLKDVIEGRKSFPSGHSSFSFCSLGFVSVWLCGKLGVLSRSRGHGVRIVACLAPLVTAAMVAISRCCDHHHHWEDVLAGSIIGYTSSHFCYRQYYHPLDSEESGMPYLYKQMWFDSTSDLECCTKDLDTHSVKYNKEKQI